MRELVKRGLRTVGLEEVARGLVRRVRGLKRYVPWRVRRMSGYVDRRIVVEYMESADTRKLHLGCGPNVLRGWLNSDYRPDSPEVLHLDVTKRFPFPDETFEYIFSEHMIEHITYEQADRMLKESYRVLKPGGILRISTPDMEFLVKLYQSNGADFEADYVKWSTATFIPDAPYPDPVFVINNFMRAWGHKFIFNEHVLRTALERIGFVGVVRKYLNESDSTDLRNLENTRRMPDGFLQFESFTLEAKK